MKYLITKWSAVHWTVQDETRKLGDFYGPDASVNAERFLLTLRKESLFRRKRAAIKKKNSRKSK